MRQPCRLRGWPSKRGCPALDKYLRDAVCGRKRTLMYKVYILKSTINNRYYIGHTENIDNRLNLHNSGRVRSTKPYSLWNIIHTETLKTRSEAQKREIEIKKYKGGIQFKKLLGLWNE